MPEPSLETLILASGSPRRRDLLTTLGIPFMVQVADVDERTHPGESSDQAAERLARDKAAAVARQHPTATILAADTIVTIDDMILGKPVDAEQNAAFLRQLMGRTHTVVTGHCMIRAGESATETVRTDVVLRTLREHEVDRWVTSGQGLDKAGGYAIQDLGAGLVGEVHGCFTNVVGLSLPAVVRLAERLGVAHV